MGAMEHGEFAVQFNAYPRSPAFAETGAQGLKHGLDVAPDDGSVWWVRKHCFQRFLLPIVHEFYSTTF